ncbi:MAG: hypothetical protein VKN13_05100 [Cyanobacteriota bacterium]|nr:hypothetical protein [Cyanobacteriota bacterium]
MSFDAHSLERLKALGRRLPQPLPEPEPPPQPVVRQHPVETERNPQQLFRELMAASTDGTVPPHLLERLRQLEAVDPRRSAPATTTSDTNRRKRPGKADGEQELYEAFADLLSLEHDDEGLRGADGGDPFRHNRNDQRLSRQPAVRPRRPA